MPTTHSVVLTENGFQLNGWNGSAFERDVLEFSMSPYLASRVLGGAIFVAVYAGNRDSVGPADPYAPDFLTHQDSTKKVGSFVVPDLSQVRIANLASLQGQYFTLTYTAPNQQGVSQTFLGAFAVNTFKGLGASVTPDDVFVLRGANVYFENAQADKVKYGIARGGRSPDHDLFTEGGNLLEAPGAKVMQRTVSLNADTGTPAYQLTRTTGTVALTGGTISISVGSSTGGGDGGWPKPPDFPVSR